MRYALSFRHVEVIHAVVLTGSATGAAERLHVTQPAVSNMLRDAQERLGFELFERKAGRLIPNANTLALFEEIERSFTGLDEVNGLAERLRRQRGRRVVLACTPVFAAVVLPRLLASLHAASPDVLFTVHSRSAEHVAALVSSQKADLGFGLTVPPMPGVHSEVLAEVPMVCYLPPGHRLARKRKAVSAADLVGEPMISFDATQGITQGRAVADYVVRNVLAQARQGSKR
jgi:DNA-binding transcriptional LysR family regulator